MMESPITYKELTFHDFFKQLKECSASQQCNLVVPSSLGIPEGTYGNINVTHTKHCFFLYSVNSNVLSYAAKTDIEDICSVS